MIRWLCIGASAASVASAATPALQPAHYVPAQPQYAQPVRSAWDTYKSRLAILAAQQGVRQSTIQTNVPGLTINQRAIDMERTEPVAHSSGGVVGVLAPYLRAHVTPSLIARGRRSEEHTSELQSQF